MPRDRFDAAAFYAALDQTRKNRKLTWRQVADEAGVSPSTLTRMAQDKRPDVDSLAALSHWSGLSVDDFVRSTESHARGDADSLGRISAILRADPNLSDRGATALEEILQASYKLFKDRGD